MLSAVFRLCQPCVAGQPLGIYVTYSTTHQRSLEVQFGRYQKSILQEWSMVKILSCVSCAAWNVFPINSLCDQWVQLCSASTIITFLHRSIHSKIYDYCEFGFKEWKLTLDPRNTKSALAHWQKNKIQKLIRCPLTSWDYGSRKLSAYNASLLSSQVNSSCQFDATKPTNALDGMFGPKARPALGEERETLQSTFSSYDFLCWISGVVPSNMWLISNWEENNWCKA